MVRKLIVFLLAVLLVLSALGYAGYALTREGMPFRILYKRMKAPTPFVYDEIRPEMRAVDPSALITTRDPLTLAAQRRRLNLAFWGTPSLYDSIPDVERLDAAPPGLPGAPPLALSERLTLRLEFEYGARAYHARPETWNGETVIYHHGYAGEFDQAAPMLTRFLDEGYAIVAVNFLGYGESRLDFVQHPRFGPMHLDHDKALIFIENPMRYYVGPVIGALNHLEERHDVTTARMIGFSAGGWVATLAAAVDERLFDTVAVASVYPLYLRDDINRGNEAPRPHFFPPLLAAANYLELFVSASVGDGRRYTQIFNQYDRCCYRNRKAELYDEAVAQAVTSSGGGTFDAIIDTTHADHKISNWALETVLDRFSKHPEPQGSARR
jgi:pimeloyl-ACP methyl ester carboxylesterase